MMIPLQLRSSRHFFSNGSSSFVFRSFLRTKRCYHNLFVFRECPRPCVQAIVECYQNRAYFEHYVREHESVSLVQREEDTVLHVALTARPDEFHKLPPKCSACGAIFQTKHDTQTGYINEKKFVDSLKKGALDKLTCFNCYSIRYHNSPVLRGVDSGAAMNQLQHLIGQRALILYIVDLFDIEGTMMSNILQLVGQKKRLIIVGNKLDRIPVDNEKQLVAKQLEAMKSTVKDIAFKNGLENCNFKDICLISAKTGFGLKTLVEKINQHRERYMNVYLIGCTNTGKSTLYNILVNLINVHKSNDLPAQAIEHHLPGTTSSFIRESISQSKMEKLVKRLKKGPYETENVFNFDDDLLDFLNVKKDDEKYQIMGTAKREVGKQNLLGQSNMIEPRPLEVVDEKSFRKEEKSCFIFDTPGILNASQLIQYLTPSEINYLSPSLWVVPRTFLLKPGYSICVGGLARLDFLSISRPQMKDEDMGGKENDLSSDVLLPSGQGIYITAMISPNVPVHLTASEVVEEKFETWFSNNFFKFPVGSSERFKQFPKLVKKEYAILGKSRNTNACDLVLHGIGWLSVAAVWGSRVSLDLYTPNGEGQNLRHNPLLPYTVQRKKGRGVMYNGRLNRNMYGHSRARCPQLIKVFEEKYKTIDTIKTWKIQIKEKLKQERFQKKENERLERIEQGIVLGRRKALMDKEEKFRLIDEQNYAKLIENKN